VEAYSRRPQREQKSKSRDYPQFRHCHFEPSGAEGEIERGIYICRPRSKTYGPKLLKALVSNIGWTEADMRRLRLIR
jgi:hypothetical protein